LTAPCEEAKRGLAAPVSQRIDKWLWQARVFKTRTLAAKVVAEGGVRLTRDGATARIEKASSTVKPGDHLVLLLGDRLRVFEVLACGVRRGPAAEARLLYADHSPPKHERETPVAARLKGAGRPTKKDRREIDRLGEGE
jgi:ribosome-associated heat shock protein Hsp15